MQEFSVFPNLVKRNGTTISSHAVLNGTHIVTLWSFTIRTKCYCLLLAQEKMPEDDFREYFMS